MLYKKSYVSRIIYKIRKTVLKENEKKIKTSATTLIKLNLFHMSESKNYIEEPNLEVLPLE